MFESFIIIFALGNPDRRPTSMLGPGVGVSITSAHPSRERLPEAQPITRPWFSKTHPLHTLRSLPGLSTHPQRSREATAPAGACGPATTVGTAVTVLISRPMPLRDLLGPFPLCECECHGRGLVIACLRPSFAVDCAGGPPATRPCIPFQHLSVQFVLRVTYPWRSDGQPTWNSSLPVCCLTAPNLSGLHVSHSRGLHHHHHYHHHLQIFLASAETDPQMLASLVLPGSRIQVGAHSFVLPGRTEQSQPSPVCDMFRSLSKPGTRTPTVKSGTKDHLFDGIVQQPVLSYVPSVERQVLDSEMFPSITGTLVSVGQQRCCLSQHHYTEDTWEQKATPDSNRCCRQRNHAGFLNVAVLRRNTQLTIPSSSGCYFPASATERLEGLGSLLSQRGSIVDNGCMTADVIRLQLSFTSSTLDRASPRPAVTLGSS
ncbi:hypothetical protein GE09DRAFT_165549 [Coniochaeta sp. 2T2.1]|nr:hypothetical protein GE09DRAFT_165549 [Coniochaeta sp. 2T2.1]